jgi:hypothetical protein
VAENDEEQQAQGPSQQDWQHQNAIDRITAQYVDEFRTGRSPRIEEYVKTYPEYTRDLLEFAVYFHTVGFDAAEPDEVPAAVLSPGADKALTRIRGLHIEGLVKQGTTVGYSPLGLAEAVGITTDLLGKLEARVITVATIPPTLVGRLAEALKVAPDAVASYLGAARPGQAGVFYYADQPPTQQQEAFLDAIQASALSPELKLDWDEIVKEDAGKGA